MVQEKRRSGRRAIALLAGWIVLATGGGAADTLLATSASPEEPQAFTVTLTPASIPTGGKLTITWTAPAGRAATDWVGLFAPGAPFEVWWVYTGGATAGTVTLDAPASPGSYEARYLLEDGYVSVATSAPVSVGGSGPPPPSQNYSVTLTPASVAPGETLTITWTAPGGRSPRDWVGLFIPGAPFEIWWSYTGGTASGSATLPAPAAGTYEARYLLDDGYASTAKSAVITVGASVPPPVTSADVVRFLEQSTFGPTTGLVAHVQNVGIEGFLDEQFNAPISSYATLPLFPTTRDTVACPNNSTCQRDNYTMYLLQNRFFVNALYGPDQLRQRVALALHQIIVVSGLDVTQPSWMAPYLQTLDRNTFGNFRQLLYEISVNPAMGRYLDITGNTKSNPNENYAREILQLFSIGTVKLNLDGTPQLDGAGQPIPTYTQTEVNNFARVFTGWRLATAAAPGVPNYIDPLVPNEAQHDTAAKTLLNGAVLPAGQNTTKDLNDALDNIFNHSNVGPFITRQLIQHLVTSNPSPSYVARVASVFNDNGSGQRGDLKAVVRAILLDAEARGDLEADPNYGHLRNPALFVANILRAFDARSANGSGQSDGYLNPRISPMGMDLFRPQSVFSYYPPGNVVPGTNGVRGPEFGILSTSTALQRANFVNTIVFSTIPVSANAPNGTSIDLAPMQALAGNPAQLVDKLNELMMHGSMSAAMRQSIIQAVSAVSASNTLKRARTAVYLVATSSQYQVER
jgi:uncharacterized protein (DUF1800 family)